MSLVLPIILSALVGGWLISTAVIDIVVVPTAFKLIPQAGTLGMALFSKFNKLELFLAILVCALALFYRFGPRKAQTTRKVLAFFLLAQSLTYNLFLTPMITKLSLGLRGELDLGVPLIDIQAKHYFYHKLYVFLDSEKMLLLIVFLILMGLKPKAPKLQEVK